MYKVAVLTISDKCSKGQREDESGKIVRELAKNIPGDVLVYEIIPDEPEMIKEKLIHYCDTMKVDLVLTNGGTGFTSRDLTPEGKELYPGYRRRCAQNASALQRGRCYQEGSPD